MAKSGNISIIGGDLRLVHLANKLSDSLNVLVFGNKHKDLLPSIHKTNNLDVAIDCSNTIIFPIPFSKNKNDIYAPFANEDVFLEDVYKKDFSDKTIVGGAFTKEFKGFIEKNQGVLVELMEDDAFEVYNSIPTAEGVIELLMQGSEITIYGSKSLILGFGKCGITQGDLLKAMGSSVTIGARNKSQLALANIKGLNTLNIEEIELNDYIGEFDFIINTVPAGLVKNIDFTHINRAQIVVDIANQLDNQIINKTKIINARGIPGKYSPKSAAEIIYKTLTDKNIIRNVK
ncbi:dipicolinate synthase subunit DpsA [Natranaerovirga pectinivora]|nr:dipicolinate synthase subunit DpsA [Natranaerovirga pectinivora]